MEELLKKIKSDYLQSFMNIPNTMARIFTNEVLKSFKKSSEEVGDEEEKNELIEETIDSIIESGEEDQIIIDKIVKKIKEKKVAIDLNTGEDAEKLLGIRVDRDIFELKYHGSFIYSQEFDLMSFSKILPLKVNELTELNQYLKDANKVINFLETMKMNLKGQIDFTIPSVKLADIIDVLSNDSKKYYIFGDKDLFKDSNYDIYGEVTLDLFSHSNYIHKMKQLIRYIILIKLIENHTEYFKTIGISTAKKAIMIVTDGKYKEFINKISESKIFSKEYKDEEFKSNSIDNIINCKKFKEELDDFYCKSVSIKNNKEDTYKKFKNYDSFHFEQMKNEYRNFKGNYEKEYKSLKSRTVNILKILKSSEVPFLLCYFPKIGGEFPYDLFADKPIVLTKEKAGNGSFQYKFTLINKNYVSPQELREHYLSKEEISKNYLSIEESNLMKEELDKLKKELQKSNKESKDLKEQLDILFQNYPELKKLSLESKKESS